MKTEFKRKKPAPEIRLRAMSKPTLQKWKTYWELGPTNLPDVSSGNVKTTVLESLHTEWKKRLSFFMLYVAYTELQVKFAPIS